ncbi:sensor histidine kinase [Sciscionella sediminilitoris]|uniref:sensor histidine kinase n=1 Tax=Sciscionella sediminilitoris TaxID=1445613 RepID=UPI00056A4A19|nr:histidine kinase [Sciscionella sp. SE31]
MSRRNQNLLAGPGHRPAHTDDEGTRALRLAPKLANLVVGIVFCCVGLLAFVMVCAQGLGPLAVFGALTCLIALFVMQLGLFGSRAGRCGSGYLAIQAVLAYLPMLAFGKAWLGMPGFLAGTALLTLPPIRAAAVFVLIVASTGLLQWLFTGFTVDIAYTCVVTVITALVVYGSTRLAKLVAEVHANRARLVETAIAEERGRFARDLHDLLGSSLSSITVKSELAYRIAQQNPARAQTEFAEVLDTSRQALADVRAVARGARELSLDREAQTVRSLLSAADVTAYVEIDCAALPPAVSGVLATVLREGVTNVLRHSAAGRCAITVRRQESTATIEIVNDGVRGETGRDETGTGLTNLSVRVAEFGGTLHTETLPGNRFRLLVAVPVREHAVTEAA